MINSPMSRLNNDSPLVVVHAGIALQIAESSAALVCKAAFLVNFAATSF
jgi:hypothetical protein